MIDHLISIVLTLTLLAALRSRDWDVRGCVRRKTIDSASVLHPPPHTRQVWQQNGDQVSRIYAGTGALTSGRSLLTDARRSAARTIQCNFFDYNKQVAMQTMHDGASYKGWKKLVAGLF